MVALPLVTIVTPSYNQVRFLEATLRSVLDQDYPSIEYLVVDGASTDGSVEIIRRYANRLTWWISEKDSGQPEAVNKGLQRARGEFVGWLNSDDIYLPGAVSAAVKVFQSHPEAGLVYGDALAIDSDGKPFNLMRARQYTLADLLAFNIICQPAAFMRRSVLDEVGYLNPSLPPAYGQSAVDVHGAEGSHRIRTTDLGSRTLPRPGQEPHARRSLWTGGQAINCRFAIPIGIFRSHPVG